VKRRVAEKTRQPVSGQQRGGLEALFPPLAFFAPKATRLSLAGKVAGTHEEGVYRSGALLTLALATKRCRLTSTRPKSH